MKKILFGLLAVMMLATAAVFTGCKGCKSETKSGGGEAAAVVYHDYDGVVQDFTAGVVNIQALHRQTMYGLIQSLESQGHTVAHPGKYEWRNSLVILNDTVTAENIDDLHVVSVRDVFYYWDNQFGPQVQYITSHVKYGVQIPWPICDVWIEDSDMSDQPIKISAEQALSRLKEYNAAIKREQNGAGSSSAEREQGGAKPNGILPKDCNFLTLRYPVGPKDCNVQWVFGDVYDVLFIDAVTGEIRDYDPAFPRK